MDFGKLANLSIGLAAFLGGLWLVLQIIKTLKRNHINEKPLLIASQPMRKATAGEQDTAYWEKRYDSIDNRLEEIIKTLDRIEKIQNREDFGRK